MIATYYWHDGVAYTEKGERLNACTWEEAQAITSSVDGLTQALFGPDTRTRILKMEPPR